MLVMSKEGDSEDATNGHDGNDHQNNDNYEGSVASPGPDNDLQKLEDLAKEGAIGDTMYDKRWVIQNILTVGRHFQSTSYVEEGRVKELDEKIEETFCLLWDMSVDQDVSLFYLEHGVLDIVTELFTNPNDRVKEISVGLMANMVAHPKVFSGVIEKDKFLEAILRMLHVQDSPTLLFVFKCLHSYGFHLFNLSRQVEDGLEQEDQGDSKVEKEEVVSWISKWLMFIAVETEVHRIGIILGSCANSDVLLNASKFLSVMSELWESCEDQRKFIHHFVEENFLHCLLEAIKESLGQDNTVKHFVVFLSLLLGEGVDKEVFITTSDQILMVAQKLYSQHILTYKSVDRSDLEFVFNLTSVVKKCLESGSFTYMANLYDTLEEVKLWNDNVEVEEDDEENKKAVQSMIESSTNILLSCAPKLFNSGVNSPRDCGKSSPSDH